MARRYVIPVFISLLLLLSSCTTGNIGKAEGTARYSYCFTDDMGNEIALTKKPEKVAVLFSSYAEIWQLAGGVVDITVGESIERGFAEENAILVDNDSGHTSIDTETLIACSPDFVIGTTDHEIQRQTALICKESNIPCALFSVETLDEYLNVLKIFTDILGTENNYEEYGKVIKEKTDKLLANICELTGEKSILFIRSGSSARSAKAKTADQNFVCGMLKDLGTYNIAENAEVLLDSLSEEEILLCDPEVIFITTMGDEDAAAEYMTSLLNSDTWSSLTAVKNGNYHFLPKEMFHYKPNARWYDAYLYLAEILYPELSLD